MSEETKTPPKIIKLWLVSGFYYEGDFIEETETHYIINDRKTKLRTTLLKNVVEKMVETDRGDG